MIAYISGEITQIEDGKLVVETGGIGYLLLVPSGPKAPYLEIGDSAKIWTHLSVTQDGVTLYGMYSREEQELFRMLITVSGIGPKGALGILSVLSPDELRFAILSEDDAAISKAPGIGKKTARKLILELKDKIDASDVWGNRIGGEIAGAVPVPDDGGAVAEAIEALTALGYRPSEARTALKNAGITADMSVEEILKAALKEL
ncbi:MAG: Holliday junction branch migration protein RuvA [Lachnospiraceae bacterium]|nr:Holliday junction branch migration protein RuvA [Lachnospiraceae bacterium]